jgi:hypothetical protein
MLLFLPGGTLSTERKCQHIGLAFSYIIVIIMCKLCVLVIFQKEIQKEEFIGSVICVDYVTVYR